MSLRNLLYYGAGLGHDCESYLTPDDCTHSPSLLHQVVTSDRRDCDCVTEHVLPNLPNPPNLPNGQEGHHERSDQSQIVRSLEPSLRAAVW